MALGSNSVSIVVLLKNKAKKGLTDLKKGLRGLKEDGISASKSLGKLALAVGAAGFALKKMADRAGKVTGVQTAFTAVTDGNVAAIGKLRKASRGLINDYELMAGFNRAVTLGSAETTEQFAQLTKTAISLGRALGVDATFALESLNLGIGRQSKLVLDNLGIIVKIEEANLKYATSIGKTVEQLTEAEKKEAFRTEAFRAAEDAILRMGANNETAADSVQRLFTNLSNMRDTLLKLVAESPQIQAFFEGLQRWTGGETYVSTDTQAAIARLREHMKRTGTDYAADVRYGGMSPGRSLKNRQRDLEQAKAQLGLIEGDIKARSPAKWMADVTLGGGQDPLTQERDALMEKVAADQAYVTMIEELIDEMEEERKAAGEVAARRREVAAMLARDVGAGGVPRLAGVDRTTRERREFLQGQMQVPQITAPPVRMSSKNMLHRLAMRDAALAEQEAQDELARTALDRARDVQSAGRMVASSLGAMAEAAIRGSDITADAVIGMVSRIVANLPGVGGLAGSIIGAAGGILGAIVGGGGKRQRIVPVSVERVSSQAASIFGPQDVSIQIVSPTTGAVLEELEYQLGRRVRRDAVSRIPKVARSDWTRSGG